MEAVVIDFQSHIKGINDADTALRRLGETDKKNAAQFESSNNRYREQVNKTVGANNNLIGSLKSIGAAVGIAFGVQQIIAFGKEAVALSLKAEEVRTAFNKLGGVDLANLRKAVNGTLSDLKLMELTVKSANLKIPFQELANIMEFAEKKAGELGLATEQVASSIIEGIGKGSSRTLKEFGLAVTELASDFDSTGKTSADALKSIRDQLDKMGPGVESSADKVERLGAKFENFKLTVGDFLVNEGVGIIDFFEKLGDGTLLENVNSLLEGSIRSLTALVTGGISEIAIAGYNDAQKNALKNTDSFLKLQAAYQNASAEQRVQLIKKTEALDEEHRKVLLEGFKSIEDSEKQSNEKKVEGKKLTDAEIKKLEQDALKRKRELIEIELKNEQEANEIAERMFEAHLQKMVNLTEAGTQERVDAEVNQIQALAKFRINNEDLTQDEIFNIQFEADEQSKELQAEFDEQEEEAQKEKQARLLANIEEFNKNRLAMEEAYVEAKIALQDAENDALIAGSELARALFKDNAGLQTTFLIFERFVAIAKIVQNSAVEIAKIGALYGGTPAAFPLIAAARVRAATGIASIVAQTIPQLKLAKGTKSVEGGEEGRDSVHALLMPGEMVIPTKRKEKYGPALEAIFDEKVSPGLMNDFVRMASNGNKPGYMIKNEMDVFTLGKLYGKESGKVVDQLKTLNRKMDGSNASKLLRRRERW